MVLLEDSSLDAPIEDVSEELSNCELVLDVTVPPLGRLTREEEDDWFCVGLGLEVCVGVLDEELGGESEEGAAVDDGGAVD